MLQRGSTLHPSSQASSPIKTPKDDRWEPAAARQDSGQCKEAVKTEPPSLLSSPAPALEEDDDPLQQPVVRTFGVHNILNPSDHRSFISTELHASEARAENEEDTAAMQGSPHYHQAASPPTRPNRHHAEDQTLPHGGNVSLPPLAGSSHPSPSAERASPNLAPHYGLGGVRRILTPRSPLTRALSHSSVSLPTTKGRHSYGAHQGFHPVTQQYDSSLPPVSISDRSAESPFFPASSMPPHPTTRSLSQPGLAFPAPDTQNPSLPGLDWSRRSVLSTGTGHGSSPSPGGIAPLAVGPPGGTPGEPWPPSARLGQAVAGGLGVADTQQFITITPTHGEEIRVPVDIHQASRQADEKRLRNAGASARFRARKKEKDKEVQVGMQRLESQNRELQKRLQEMEAERDFYRGERNRLRHIMYREPGMREAAESGPPSPTSTAQSGGSFVAEHSPMPALPPQQPSAPISSYLSDPSAMERPARRRRTDPAPGLDFSTPAYGSPGPSHLPPIPASSFVPAPGLPNTSSTGQRLPPLRGLGASQPLPGSESGPLLAAMPTGSQPSQLPPYGRHPYESQWQAGPRHPHDHGPR